MEDRQKKGKGGRIHSRQVLLSVLKSHKEVWTFRNKSDEGDGPY